MRQKGSINFFLKFFRKRSILRQEYSHIKSKFYKLFEQFTIIRFPPSRRQRRNAKLWRNNSHVRIQNSLEKKKKRIKAE